jgi:hypothetical protein
LHTIFHVIVYSRFVTLLITFLKCCALHFNQIHNKARNNIVLCLGIDHDNKYNVLQVNRESMDTDVDKRANGHFQEVRHSNIFGS